MTPSLRKPPEDTVHDASTDPITWVAARRTLVIATAIGAFLSFVGAFGTQDMPFLPRTLYVVVISWAGGAVGLFTYRLVTRLGWGAGRRYVQGAIAATVMTVPMGLLVWGSTQIVAGGGAPIAQLPGYVLTSFVISQALTAFAVVLNRRAHYADLHLAAPGGVAAPPKFLDRLPLKLRGAEVWAVEAEDHYLRLHTSKGQDLILMRLADAVDELAGIEGTQVHRSWWVARDAIADAQRGDGRATLTLKDGAQVPVSRTYAKIIRELGWI